jgi:uncharacterized protein YecE (DUF72 family)
LESDLRIGTVDVPPRIERERYFGELSYVELTATFAQPLKPSAITRWKACAPAGSIGLVAPWQVTHRDPPRGVTSNERGDELRGQAPAAIARLSAEIAALEASCVVFRSPPLFAPSQDHRDRLRRFFAELAISAQRVWIPDGLWEPLDAIAFASELGVTCAFDPLVRAPGVPLEIYTDLDLAAVYLRIEGIGRAGRLRAERLDDLAILVERYENVPITIAFASADRWQDARNLKKLLDR